LDFKNNEIVMEENITKRIDDNYKTEKLLITETHSDKENQITEPKEKIKEENQTLTQKEITINENSYKIEEERQKKEYSKYSFGTIMFIGFNSKTKSEEKQKEISKLIKTESKSYSDDLLELHIDDNYIIGLIFLSHKILDHQLKAIKCALSIKQTFKVKQLNDIGLKIGIDTGRLRNEEKDIIMNIGSHEDVAYQLFLKSENQNILVSENTILQIKGLFKYTILDKIKLEGKRYPIITYVIKDEKQFPYLIESFLIGDTEIPFIGNERQMAILKDSFEKSYRNNQTQFITISGIANSGKTRIATELLKYIDSKDIEINLYRSNCSCENDKLISMKAFKKAFIDKILYSNGNKTPIDNQKNIVSILSQRLKLILEGKIPNIDDAINLVLSFLDINQTNKEEIKNYNKQENIEAKAFFILKTIMEYLSDIKDNSEISDEESPPNKIPIVLIVDDLQWVDEISIRFIKYISASIRNRPVFIMCITRPIFFNSHSDWNKYKDYHQLIEMNHLTSSERINFIQKLLHKIDDVPADFIHTLSKTSSGNPSHIIELVRLLIDQKLILINEDEDLWYPDLSGIKNYILPSSLDYTIVVRYTLLTELEKRILALISIIGCDTPLLLIEKLINEDLYGKISDLQGKQFLFFDVNINNRNFSLVFTSHYARIGINKSINKNERFNHHLSVYNNLSETLDNNSIPSQELLINTALHLLNIGGKEKAVSLLMHSSRISLENGSKFIVIEIYNKIGSSINLYNYPEIAFELYLNKGNILLEDGNYLDSAKNFDALLSVAEKNEKPEMVCEAMVKLSITFEKMNDLDRSYEYARNSLSIAERISNAKLKAFANMCIGNIFEKKGQINDAYEYFSRTEVLVKTINDKSELSKILQALGRINQKKRDYDKAIDFYKRAIDLNNSLENKFNVCSLLISIGDVYKEKNLPEKAYEEYKEALQLSESIEDRINNAMAFEKIAEVSMEMKQEDEALTYYLEALEIQKELNNREKIGKILYEIGSIYRNKEKFRNSTEYFDKALDIFNEIDDKIGIAKTLKNIAEIYKQTENYRSALRCYEKAIDIMEQIQYKEGLISAYMEIGEIYRSIGDNEKAVEYRAKITLIKKTQNIEKIS